MHVLDIKVHYFFNVFCSNIVSMKRSKQMFDAVRKLFSEGVTINNNW